MVHLKNSRILIVDDVAENLEVLGNLLITKEFRVAVAGNGSQAIKISKTVKPDLILLDVSMPDIDGFEVCRQIKKDNNTKDIPIIFLTARTEIEDIKKGFEYGAVDYVTKPFDSVELIARVTTHLELKKSRDLIAFKNNELNTLNAQKDKFFSIIAHDLKNSFTGVIGYSEILADDLDELEKEEIKSIAHGLHSSSKRLFNLLSNLLDWARLQTGKTQLNLERVKLQEVISETCEILEDTAIKKKIKLDYQKLPDLFVKADENMIRSILHNFIHNSIKFTESGGSVNISAVKEDAFIKITVKDTGVGIPQDRLKEILRIDMHLSTNGTDQEEGTGLGLILCKDLIEKQGGELFIESEVGKGSSFSFTVPCYAGS